VKFSGCYHGHADSLLVKSGSGALTLSSPDSAGIPAALAQKTRVLPYNDVEAMKELFRREGQSIAARDRGADRRQYGPDPAPARLSRRTAPADHPAWHAVDF